MAKERGRALPKTVRIGCINYQVIICERKLIRGDGRICYDDSMIQIDESLGEQEAWATLWHEMFHGVCYEAGCNPTEPEVDRMSRLLMSLVRDNRELVR